MGNVKVMLNKSRTLPNEIIKNICVGASRKQTFVFYPSVEIAIPEERYCEAAITVAEVNNTFLTEEAIIIPMVENDVVEILLNHYQGRIIDTDKGSKFATLAIAKGVPHDLVLLGNAIESISQISEAEMVSLALSQPEATRTSWKELYLLSMNEH